MVKKIIALSILTIAFGGLGLLVHTQTAHAAQTFWQDYCGVSGPRISACEGYFTGASPNCTSSSSSSCKESVDDVISNGMEVNDMASFISTVEYDLNGQNNPNPEDTCGAALIIVTMMNQGPFRYSSCTQGVATAEGELGQWESLVQSYDSPTTPAGYGVNWDVNDQPTVNSTWIPGINDDIFSASTYWCENNFCGGPSAPGDPQGTCSLPGCVLPVIQFYFPIPGGTGTFEIERPCANLVGSLTPLPTIKQAQPHGSISITCPNPSTGQYDVIVQYGDSNGFSTSGTISSNNGWNPGNVASPSTTPIPTSYANPYSPPPSVILTVTDNGAQTPYTYTPPPPASCISSPACNLSLVSPPGLIDPYTPFSVTANVTYSPSQAPPTPPSMQLVITNPSGAQAYNSSQNVNGNSPASVTFSISALNNGTGNYAATGTLTSTYFSPIICHTTIPVVDLPYLQVYGGDTMIGGSPTYSSGGSTCATLPTASGPAGIYSWNKDDSPNYSGAGDQYAVQVLGQINGFVSGQNSTNSPTGLSFSNSSVTPNSGLFGGSFFAPPADCDFTSDIASDPNATTYTTNQTIAQNAVMNVSAQSNGAPTIIYVKDANVYIANSITYGNTNWASPSKIPDFELVVVGGNIYVSDNVTELDGLYVAEPDTGRSPQGGAIYTCGNPNYTPVTAASSSYYGSCTNKLTIYGSFVAQQVQFLRTNGTVGQASSDTLSNNHAAEVFDYTPEMWLPRGNSNPNSGYEAITGLPPVL